MRKNIAILVVGLLFMIGCEDVNITAEIHAPVAKNDSVEVVSGEHITIDILHNDSDDGALDRGSVKIVTKPLHGTATILDTGKVTFVAKSDYVGADKFTYTVKDDNGNVSNEAVVTLTIVAKNTPTTPPTPAPHTNRAPVANNDHFSVAQNTTIVMDILKNDVDSDGSIDKNSMNLVTSVTHGTMTVDANGLISYKSYSSYSGLDFFKYSIKDNKGAYSNIATVYINVYRPQSSVIMVAKDDKVEVLKGSSTIISVLDNDSNSSGALDKRSVVVVQKPQNGSTFVSTTNGTITYVANSDFVGSDFFTYRVKNEKGVLSNEANVTVVVEEEVASARLIESQAPEEKPKEWYVRIVVEDTSNHMKVSDAQLGELDTDEVSTYALKALAPFGTTFLDVVFKNPEGLATGEYKSDFHPCSTDAQSWEFTVKSSESNATMILSWRGLYVLTPYVDSEGREQYHEYRSLRNPLLSYMTLVDMETNQEVKVVENNKAQTYLFEMNGSTQRRFQWRLKDPTVPLASPLLATTSTPYKKTLKALQIKVLRKDAKATPTRDTKRRLEQLDMLTPPEFKVLVE